MNRRPRLAVPERSLLWLGLMAVGLAYAIMLLARLPPGGGGRLDLQSFYPLGGFVALAVLVRGALAVIRFRGDPVLLAAGMFLAGLGVVVQARLGMLEFTEIERWSNYALPGGVGIMLLLAWALRRGRLRAWRPLHIPAAWLALAVLVFMLLAGRRFRGGMYLEGNINPTEVVKVCLVFYLAGMLALYRKAFERPMLPGVPTLETGLVVSLALCWLPCMGALVLLRDMGLIVLLNSVLLVMVVLAGGRWGYLLSGMLVAGAAGAALITVMPHGGGRIDVWLDPFADPTGKGWQVLQGLSAMCSGGLWGAGIGAGSPAAIPIAASDFVYAALAEEIGYVGCGLVLGVYLLFFYRGFRLADSLSDPFEQSLATGITAALALQTLLNLGGVTKAIPLTGITLPFLSHGGSSLVVSLGMLGLLLALSEPGAKAPSGGRGAKKRR